VFKGTLLDPEVIAQHNTTGIAIKKIDCEHFFLFFSLFMILSHPGILPFTLFATLQLTPS